MRIVEVTFRHRNDFHFNAACDCGKTSKYRDGYADTFYQYRVFPARACPHCGLNEHGLTEGREPLATMTYHDGVAS